MFITKFSHLNDILKTKKGTKISKFISWKGFGEYIWHLTLSIKIIMLISFLWEEFSNHVDLEINVLCALIKFMIYHHVHNILIFTIQVIGLLLRVVRKKYPKPNNLFRVKASCNIFILYNWSNYAWTFSCNSTNMNLIEKNYMTNFRLSII